jgi:hypothetical protein
VPKQYIQDREDKASIEGKSSNMQAVYRKHQKLEETTLLKVNIDMYTVGSCMAFCISFWIFFLLVTYNPHSKEQNESTSPCI